MRKSEHLSPSRAVPPPNIWPKLAHYTSPSSVNLVKLAHEHIDSTVKATLLTHTVHCLEVLTVGSGGDALCPYLNVLHWITLYRKSWGG